MRRLILLAALAVVLAPAVHAAGSYPHTLIDQSCTDIYDVPAAYTPSEVTALGGPRRVILPSALVQVSGSPDGFCDNDSRIIYGNITADTDLGPLILPTQSKCFLWFFNGDTVTGGDTTYDMKILAVAAHDGAKKVVGTVEITGTGDQVYSVGADPNVAGGNFLEITVPVPRPFYLRVNFEAGGATLITAESSIVACQ
jgi:hypothetical protein